MRNVVRKGYCEACPFDHGKHWTEYACNLCCLPGVSEIRVLCEANGTAWACHSEPDKVCCGDAAGRERPLQYMEGVHPDSHVKEAG